MKANSLAIIVIILLSACSEKEMMPKEFANYVASEESGLLVKKQVNEFVFELLYEPIEYKIVNQLRAENVSNAEYNELEDAMKGMQYYVLKIGVEGSNKSILKYLLESEEDYQNRLAYFSFGFQNSIYIEEDGVQIPCSLFHFERAYDLTPKRTFVLGFEQNSKTKYNDKTIVIDSDFFKTGKVKIKINGSDIESLPSLILND